MLRIDNNWENLTFYINEEEIDPSEIVGVAVMKDNDVGSLKTFPTMAQKSYRSYGDMGHTYHVTTTTLMIGLTLLPGLLVWVDIEDNSDLVDMNFLGMIYSVMLKDGTTVVMERNMDE